MAYEYLDYPYTYEQYINANTDKLLQGIAKVKHNHLKKAYDTIKSDIMNLRTAKGNALDMWGRLLNFSRFIPILSNLDLTREQYKLLFPDRLNTFEFFSCNFFELTFAKGNKSGGTNSDFFTLQDDDYRRVLIFLYQTQNMDITIQSLTNSIKYILLIDDIVVIDNFDMTFSVNYDKEKIPFWLDWIINQYDLIPRPSGVLLNTNHRHDKKPDYIGFNGQELHNYYDSYFHEQEYQEIESEPDYIGFNGQELHNFYKSFYHKQDSIIEQEYQEIKSEPDYIGFNGQELHNFYKSFYHKQNRRFI